MPHPPEPRDPARAPRPRGFAAWPKPADVPYGYVDQRPRPSTREELIARLREGQPMQLVWTPETEGIVPHWTVPYLFQAYREHGMKHARNVAMFWAAVCVGIVAYAAVAGALHFGAPITIFAFIAGVLAFHSAFEHRSFRRLTPDQMTLRVREAQSRPPARQGPPRYTQVLAASIALVFVVQLVSVVVPPPYRLPAGVDRWSATALAAGVIKDAVRAGEWWRLLSGTYLHGNLWHFGFNVMALLALGRMVEAFAHRAYVPLVYLLSGIAASVVSQFASPHIDSVGASGAILGLFGFLAVMARRRREMMPPGFGRAIIMDVAVIAAMGVVGLGYIDNWAHAGGFVSGALIGALAIPKGGERPYWEPSRTIRLAGDVSLGILCLAGIATAAVLAWRIYVVFPALAKI